MSAVWNIMMTGISVGAVFGSLFYTSAFSLIVACSTPIRAILTLFHAILTLGVIMLEFFKTRSGMLVIKVL